jgi:hypothetical protein
MQTWSGMATWLALVLVAGASGAGGIEAQEFSTRLSLGPAVSAAPGGLATVGAGLRVVEVTALGEAAAVAIGGTGEWEGSARMILLGGALSLAQGRPGSRAQPYVLARAATGADPREGDQVTAVGAAVGAALGARAARRPGLLAEVRYDRWHQRGARHDVLPRHVFAATIGVTIGAPLR